MRIYIVYGVDYCESDLGTQGVVPVLIGARKSRESAEELLKNASPYYLQLRIGMQELGE